MQFPHFSQACPADVRWKMRLKYSLASVVFFSILQTKRNVFQHCHHRSVNKHRKHHQHSWVIYTFFVAVGIVVAAVCVFVFFRFIFYVVFVLSFITARRYPVLGTSPGWPCLGMRTKPRVNECAVFFASLSLTHLCMVLWRLRIDKVISNYNTQSFPSLPLFSFSRCCPVVCFPLNINEFFMLHFLLSNLICFSFLCPLKCLCTRRFHIGFWYVFSQNGIWNFLLFYLSCTFAHSLNHPFVQSFLLFCYDGVCIYVLSPHANTNTAKKITNVFGEKTFKQRPEVSERVKGTRLADGENSTQYSFYNGKAAPTKKPLQMATIHAEIKLLSRGMWTCYFPTPLHSVSHPLSLSIPLFFRFLCSHFVL